MAYHYNTTAGTEVRRNVA